MLAVSKPLMLWVLLFMLWRASKPGRIDRHHAPNDIIVRPFISAVVPVFKGPSDLFPDYQKVRRRHLMTSHLRTRWRTRTFETIMLPLLH